MVYIELEEKNEQYTDGEDKVTPKKEKCITNFHKVTHEIKFAKKFVSSVWISISGSTPNNIYIKYKGSKSFTYYVVDESHVVDQVQAYFYDFHPNIPLIIGLKAENTSEFKYYTFTFLRGIGTSTGFPKQQGIPPNELESKLRYENEKRNKIKFVTKAWQSQNYDLIKDHSTSPGFTRYEYFAKDDKLYHEHRVAKDKLFSDETLKDNASIDKLLNELNGCLFDFVTIYYTNPGNMASLIEFKNESSKIHLQRKDKKGTHWIKNNLHYEYQNTLDSHLKDVKKQFEKSATYQLNKNSGHYNDKTTTVTQPLVKSDIYFLYTHKFDTIDPFSTTYVVYNSKEITAVDNALIKVQGDELPPSKIQNSRFSQISTYALSDNENEHLIIKLTSDKNVDYYLHRFNKDGTKWRYLSLQELNDAGINASGVTKEQNLAKKLDSILNEDAKWKLLLEYIRFIINSLVVLINHLSQYTNIDIQKIVGEIGSEKEVPPIDINTNIIDVTDETSTTVGQCIKSKGFNIHKHNLEKSGKAGKERAGDKSNLYLRFYLDGKRITLYDNDGDDEIPAHLIYTPGKNDLYVYFHAHGSTVPILLCYKGKAYKAKDKDSYHSKWILEKSITDCVCKGGDRSSSNTNLLSGLRKSKFSNVLYLYQQIDSQREYHSSHLFYWRNHQADNSKEGNIDVYLKNDGNKLILKPDLTFSNAVLSYAIVYFNRYDNTNTPLLVTLSFKHNQGKYYKLSEFQNDLSKGKSISSLNHYNGNDSTLLQPLIQENEKTQGILTYNIENTPSNSSKGQYNNNKINIIDDSNGILDLKKNGFRKYKHTPGNGHDAKNSCVIHKNNVLVCWSDTEKKSKTIDHIQGKVLKSFNTYFTVKNDKEPLFLAFEIKETSSVEWKYYYQKKDKGKLYFQILDKNASNALLGKYTEEDKIRSELIEKTSSLIQILKIIEFFYVNTVVLLIEKKGESYSKSEVDNAIIKTEPKLTPNSKSTNAQPDRIVLSKESCLEIEKYGYKHISHIIKPNGSPDTSELRLLIPTSSGNGSYSEINLYDSDSSANSIILKYSKDQSKLYVYFYGDDPRPLLLSYKGSFYRPKNKTEYDSYKWRKVEVSTCESSSTNDSLPKVLTEVIGCLTKVQLNHNDVRNPYSVHQFNGTQVQVNVTSQNIPARELSRPSCYKILTHRPNGYDSTTGSDFRLGDINYTSTGSSGSINYYAHGSNQSYHKWKPLVKVISYFYDKDENYKDPLLVELEFKASPGPGHKEFYRLSKTGQTLVWERDPDAKGSVKSGGEKLIQYLEVIRQAGKNVVQVRIDNANPYDLKGSKQPAVKSQFVPLDRSTQIQVSEETPCKNLKEANYKCIKHQLSSVGAANHYQIGALKFFISQKLSKNGPTSTSSDQSIYLYNVKANKEQEVMQKIKEKKKDKDKEQSELYKEIQDDLEEYKSVHYTACMGDLYVYFYHRISDKSDKPSETDPRPGLVCFDGRAYRPIKLPELKEDNYTYTGNDDYIRWIRLSDITRCGCKEPDVLIKELNEVYNIETMNIVLIAGSSAGGLTGAVGVGALGFFVFKKVVGVSVTAATVAGVAL